MRTIQIYKKDRYLSKLQSQILEAFTLPSPNNSDAGIILKETIFFPGGGGQSCDMGSINGYPVVRVYEDQGEIIHQIKDGAKLLAEEKLIQGIQCEMELDWDRRFDNMQRHCGEHILSGICYRLWGGVNRGFHMGDDYMTIDISLEDNPQYKELTWDMVQEAELEANKVIWQDLPVTPHHFDTKEEAVKMPVRKQIAIDEDITIVTIGSEQNPADSVACCGTHPSTAGQVGLIKIYKVEPNKGMYRIYFEAGKRALLGYRQRYDVLAKLEKDLSAGFPDLMDKYKARQEKNREIKDRLYHLTKETIEKEKERLLSEIDTGHSVYEYSNLTIDDLIEMGRALEGNIPGLLHLVHCPSNTLLMFSDNIDCGKLVKDNASVFNGKGGGNKKFARAIFNRPDDLHLFIDAIDKLSR